MERRKTLKAFGYIITVLLIVFTALTALSVTGSAETDGDYTYEVLADGSAEITDYTGSAATLTIPSEIGGYKVTSIGRYAFSNCQTLTTVTIPDGVTSLKYEAFYNCNTLITANIPASVTTIESSVFYTCDSLSSVKLPDGLTKIPYGLFSNCEKLTEVTVPDSVTVIESYAFSNCYKLSGFKMPPSVTSIGKFAFSSCESLTDITLPTTLTEINEKAFFGCESLTEIVIPDSVTFLGHSAFNDCKGLTKLTISSGIKEIKINTFFDCEKLTSVIIPEGVEYIGEWAFCNCKALTEISLPASLTSVESNAFKDCEALKSISVAESNTAYKSVDGVLLTKDGKTLVICPEAKAAEKYTVPDGVTAIGDYAFLNCKSLGEIVLPGSVTAIGTEAFCYCTGLKNVTLSSSLKSIGERAFEYCEALTGITIPGSVTDISKSSFSGCTSMTKAVILEGVKNIKQYAFSGCEALTSVTLPDGLLSIGDSAFSACVKLETINIPNGVEVISKYAFNHCQSLKAVNIPDGVANIGESAFYYCEAITDVNIPASVLYIGDKAFTGCKNLTAINVNENNTMYKSINGTLLTKDGTVLILCPGGKKLESYQVPDGVTELKAYSFAECDALKIITLPKSLERIGAYVFNENLTDICYKGTEEEWDDVSITMGSEDIIYLKYHYNYNPDGVAPFVDRLYVILLGRNAEPEGLADWTNKLSTGVSTSAEIVYGIAGSPEFNNRGLSNEEVVEKMYEAMLGRPSDEGGKANWVNCLNSGMTVTGIINGFSGSQEFANICGEYGIKAGAISKCDARDKNSGLTLFVSRMYTKALGRPYDVNGLNYWTKRYITEICDISDISYGFIFSQEFLSKGLNDSDYVDTLYRTFFDREPDNGGKSDWLGKLKNGSSREDVLNGFLGSQECINLVTSFVGIPDPNSSLSKKAYEAIMALQEEFPTGTRLGGNDFYYKWNGGIYSGACGCLGFAFMLSDAGFGTLPARIHEDLDSLRVGDILRLYNSGYSVVVLNIKGDTVTFAEGDHNGAVRWGGKMTKQEIAETNPTIITRYPEE